MTSDLMVQSVPIDSISPDTRNARRHPERQLAALAASLAEFGQRRPLVITSSRIIVAGNGTWQAAKRLGWETIAVTVLPFTDKERTKAFAIADNRIADLATWDADLLAEMLEEVQAADLLHATGFTEFEFDDVRVLDSSPSGITAAATLDEQLSRYAEQTVRLLICEYTNEEYAWVMAALTRVRDENALTSNTAAVKYLLEEYVR